MWRVTEIVSIVHSRIWWRVMNANHCSIRQNIADWLGRKGIVLNGIVDEKYCNFNSYLKSLRTDGNYDYIVKKQS